MLTRNVLVLGVFAFGAVLARFVGDWAVAGYLAFGLTLILATMKRACRYCAHYGKRCDTGLGLVVKVLFPGGVHDPRRFAKAAAQLVPTFILLFLLPLAAGVYGLITAYSGHRLLMACLYLLFLAGLAATTPLMACKNCRMRKVCPFCMLRDNSGN